MVTAGPGPLVVLIGPPGVGKSTVARQLGTLLSAPVADTDEMVVERAGKSISDIFLDEGEAAFRVVERQCVATALAEHTGVLALGGGAILDPDTQADLAGRAVAFLDVSLRQAASRTGFDQGRPLLELNPRGQWLRLMQQRRPLYEQLATVRVDTDDLDAAEVAERIASELGLTPAPDPLGDQR